MKENELKPHWQWLIGEIGKKVNGKCIIYFEEKLPIKIEDIEGREREIKYSAD